MKIRGWRIFWYGVGFYLMIAGFNDMDWGDPLWRYGSGWPAYLAGLIWCLFGTYLFFGGILLMHRVSIGSLDD